MVNPRIIYTQPLLGEDVEVHMFFGTIDRRKSVRGYLQKGFLKYIICIVVMKIRLKRLKEEALITSLKLMINGVTPEEGVYLSMTFGEQDTAFNEALNNAPTIQEPSPTQEKATSVSKEEMKPSEDVIMDKETVIEDASNEEVNALLEDTQITKTTQTHSLSIIYTHFL